MYFFFITRLWCNISILVYTKAKDAIDQRIFKICLVEKEETIENDFVLKHSKSRGKTMIE